MSDETRLGRDVEAERGRLVAMAARMLGSNAEAEDAVQEAWLRLSRQEAGTVDNVAGWLTTMVGRICLDVLRQRRAHPQASLDEPPQELVVTEDEGGPEDSAVLADSVGLALMVVLDTLGPDERLAFVLHDLFAVPFAEIGPIVGRSPDAAKMLASRARRKVQGSSATGEGRARQREVVDAFIAAAREGDFERLLELLDPDITWTTHHPHGRVVRLGQTEVVAAADRGLRAAVAVRRVLVNGEPGILAWSRSGKPLGLMACTVSGGRITEVVAVLDPTRLAAIDLPEGPVP
ncbi:sigma-70 family RNA polymerase sigma factor [Janibacter hoylei]|uniref:sigma-70 family RNA polymerase sigma factor n=1 Tax=Janibacter hoylei TaxID=364298 RepID=UPI003674EB0B